MSVTLEPVSDGVRVLDDSGKLLAHVTSKWPDDDHKDHVVTWESMERDQWLVRTNGPLTFAELEALLAALPAE